MPNEGQDVNTAVDPSTPQSAPTGTAPTEPKTEQGHMVPSGRLKEEADKRRTAESRAAKAEEQNQQLQAYLAKLYQQTQQAPAPAQPATSPVDEFLDSTFGTDEAGRKARRAVEALADKKIKEQGYVSKPEMEKFVSQAVAGVTGRWQSTVNVANQLQEMHREGLIDNDELTAMSQEVTDRLSAPGMESVVSNPVQMKYVVDSVIADSFRGRRFKAVQPMRPTNPLQPGNGSSMGDAPPKFNPAESPFQSLREMKPEESDRLLALSARRNRGGR